MMTAMRWTRQCLLALLLSVVSVCAYVPVQASEEFTPQIGQAGKDVVWVPSPQALVDKMLDMAGVTPADFVMDLGSGDGRTVITAAKRGVRALGVEYNPDMVALSRKNAAAAGVSARAKFVQADIFESDLSRATVITLFLLPELNVRLRPTLLSLKPGLRVVSNSFKMGEWEPDQTFELGCDTYCTAYLWIVPAKVQGKWQLAQGQGELALNQEFQKITGTLRKGATSTPISGGSMNGSEISFIAAGAEYRGRVVDRVIEGTVRNGGATAPWSARL